MYKREEKVGEKKKHHSVVILQCWVVLQNVIWRRRTRTVFSSRFPFPQLPIGRSVNETWRAVRARRVIVVDEKYQGLTISLAETGNPAEKESYLCCVPATLWRVSHDASRGCT